MALGVVFSAIQVYFFWVSNRWVDPACCFCCFLPNLPVEMYLTRLWWARHHSVHYRNLWAPSFTPTTSRKNGIVCLALINTRGLTNKTFLLNEFFTSPELDFIFLTETWLCTGEFTPFLELLPPDCLFFSSSQTAGRGGGLTTVFKSSFQCQKSTSNSFSTFELQSNGLWSTALLRWITVNYDEFLIVGDFNIWLYQDSCSRNFLILLKHLILLSLCLVQHMKKDTHWTYCYRFI